ncbi:MAG TPA: class I SAM-dependent methyltransferase [Acidimicrobiales bacterium]|nr:class I SAM-dependent methyltransferase [Acidimicrobiales bacterium]
MDPAAIRDLIAQTGWYHSIDLGHGIVTPGLSQNVIDRAYFPDVRGKSVLDIGAWDGLYSFWAENNGASRVVAMDRYVWGLDFVARQAYWQSCAERGEYPDHDRDATDFFDESLPGRRGFEIAKQVLDSSVEPYVADLSDVDPADVGTFDVVFCLGVLYHLPDVFGAIRTLRRITREVALIETEAIEVPALGERAVCEFLPGDQLNADFGNWFIVSAAALTGMCRAAGFSRVEVVQGPGVPSPAGPDSPLARLRQRVRNAVPVAPPQRYRIVTRAYV